MLSEFARGLNLKLPLIVAPMAGGPTTPEFVIASCESGALGSVGGAYYSSSALLEFVAQARAGTMRPFAINLFIPELEPLVSPTQVERAIEVTRRYRDELNLPRPSVAPPFAENFDEQFEAVLRIKPKVFSFVFGLLGIEYVKAARREVIQLVGTATTLEEALALEESGIDAIVLQGVEAGGHRGIFNSVAADPRVEAFRLLEMCRAKVRLPMILAGGLMTAADIRRALAGGAQAVQMGTAFLACKEAGTSSAYRRALLATPHRQTKLTRAFSGRWARGIENRFLREMEGSHEAILPFPVQNKFTRDLRGESAKRGSADFLSLWAGTGDGDLWTGSVAEKIASLFPPD